MIIGFKESKTTHNGILYYLVYVEMLTGSKLYKFKTRQEAVNFIANGFKN